jgi:hypothetical protein
LGNRHICWPRLDDAAGSGHLGGIIAMLNRFLRLRSCRFLALLASLLLAGVLPHGHVEASELSGSVMMVAVPDSGDAPDHGPASPAHCGICHAARAVLPHQAGTGAANEISADLVAPAVTAALEGQHGQVPARPPRAGTPA